MTTERTYSRNDREWKNLNAVAKMLESVSKNGYRYEVEDCYFDFGQNWMYTTVICHNPNATGLLSSWQVGCPRDWENIVEAETIEDLAKVVETIRADKYFRD